MTAKERMITDLEGGTPDVVPTAYGYDGILIPESWASDIISPQQYKAESNTGGIKWILLCNGTH